MFSCCALACACAMAPCASSAAVQTCSCAMPLCAGSAVVQTCSCATPPCAGSAAVTWLVPAPLEKVWVQVPFEEHSSIFWTLLFTWKKSCWLTLRPFLDPKAHFPRHHLHKGFLWWTVRSDSIHIFLFTLFLFRLNETKTKTRSNHVFKSNSALVLIKIQQSLHEVFSGNSS